MITRAKQTAGVLMALTGALAFIAPAALAQSTDDPMEPDYEDPSPAQPAGDYEEPMPAPPPPPAPDEEADFDPDYEPDYDAPPPPASTYTEPRPQPTTTNIAVVGTVEEPEPERYGIAFSVGGGVMGFIDEDMRDVADVGGSWEARAAFGTRSFFAVEAAYVGTAQNIDSVIGPSREGTLVGNGAEGAVRVNFSPKTAANVYAFGGLNWTRYDVVDANFSRAAAGVADEDDVWQIPFGAGAEYRYMGFIGDIRFTYRAAFEEDLVVDTSLNADPGDRLGMDTWGVTARVGYEF